MQNAFNKITAYLPHNWVELNGLRRFFLVVFYLTLAIGLYAAVCWAGTFLLRPEIWPPRPRRCAVFTD